MKQVIKTNLWGIIYVVITEKTMKSIVHIVLKSFLKKVHSNIVYHKPINIVEENEKLYFSLHSTIPVTFYPVNN